MFPKMSICAAQPVNPPLGFMPTTASTARRLSLIKVKSRGNPVSHCRTRKLWIKQQIMRGGFAVSFDPQIALQRSTRPGREALPSQRTRGANVKGAARRQRRCYRVEAGDC